MTTHQFFITPENFEADRVRLPADIQSQIMRVLRLKAGDTVQVLDNQGNICSVVLENTGDSGLLGKIISSGRVNTEPRVRLVLYFGLTRRDKVEWILQKGAELGVAVFQPFISRRTLAQKPGSAEKHQSRWQAILREAAEQSGRGCIPEISSPVSLKDAVVAAISTHGRVLAAWEDEKTADLKTALGMRDFASLGLFCGPEGGFDATEIDLMRAAGLQFFSLGKRILRMETAAILAPALALYELGEMGLSE